MGRSNPSASVDNPVKHYINFEADKTKGYLSIYDKESKTNIKLPDNSKFIVLETKPFKVSGFHHTTNKAISSNIGIKYSQDKLTVRCLGERDPFAYGTWKEIKERVKAVGGKFCRLIYVMEVETGQISCIQLKGNAIQSWGDSLERCGFNEYSHEKEPIWVQLEGVEEKKAAGNGYMSPVFKFAKVDTTKPKGAELDEQSIECDKLVQAYLAQVIKGGEAQEEEEEEHEEEYAETSTTATGGVPNDPKFLNGRAREVYNKATDKSQPFQKEGEDDDLPF